MNIHRVPQSSTTPGFKLKPFLVVATRDTSTSYSLVSMSFDPAKDFADYEEQVKNMNTSCVEACYLRVINYKRKHINILLIMTINERRI